MSDTIEIRGDLYPTGRKHCRRCGHWRLLMEFGLAHQSRNPGVLRSNCRTCERIVGRWRNAIRRGHTTPYGQRTRATHCKRGHPLTEDNTYIQYSNGYACRQCLACNRIRRKTPEYREWNRFRLERKRREAGVPIRKPTRTTPRGREEKMRVPVGPFSNWLKELVLRHGLHDAITRTGLGRRQFAASMNQERAQVHIDTVDRALIEDGTTHLSDLYPELYAEAA